MIIYYPESKKTYKIRFHRNKTPGKVEFDTHCQIFLQDVENSSPLVAIGVAHLNPKDRYNKIIGKKIALTRALRWNFPKPLRKMIWAAFYKEFGRWY